MGCEGHPGTPTLTKLFISNPETQDEGVQHSAVHLSSSSSERPLAWRSLNQPAVCKAFQPHTDRLNIDQSLGLGKGHLSTSNQALFSEAFLSHCCFHEHDPRIMCTMKRVSVIRTHLRAHTHTASPTHTVTILHAQMLLVAREHCYRTYF